MKQSERTLGQLRMSSYPIFPCCASWLFKAHCSWRAADDKSAASGHYFPAFMAKAEMAQPDKPSSKIVPAILAFGAVTVLAIAVFSLSKLLVNYGRLNRDAYLAEHTSLLIVRYMDKHDDRLPDDWRDLESVFPGSPAESEGFSVEELRARVEVRFEDIASDSFAHKTFILSDASLGNPDPNERVRNRLNQIDRGKARDSDEGRGRRSANAIIGDWSIERLDIANEKGVVRIADSGSVRITKALLEISYTAEERPHQHPFEYSLDERSATIDLTAGEWAGGIPGAGPNRYRGQYQIDGKVLRLCFGRFHRPDSFTSKPLEPLVDESFATPGSDQAWFLTLKRIE